MYRVALVQEPFLVQLFQQIPQSFDVAVVVGDVRVAHVYPVSHLVRQIFPLAGELHDVGTAFFVVVGHGNRFPYVFFRDAEFLFYAQFNG